MLNIQLFLKYVRGQLIVTQDGKRHVSFGRGYTMYEIPNPDPEIQKQIKAVYEKRITVRKRIIKYFS